MGLRVSEAMGLNVDHLLTLDQANCARILVLRKGRKEQALPRTEDVRRALVAWMRVRPNVPTPALFFRIPFHRANPRLYDRGRGTDREAQGVQPSDRGTDGGRHLYKARPPGFLPAFRRSASPRSPQLCQTASAPGPVGRRGRKSEDGASTGAFSPTITPLESKLGRRQ